MTRWRDGIGVAGDLITLWLGAPLVVGAVVAGLGYVGQLPAPLVAVAALTAFGVTMMTLGYVRQRHWRAAQESRVSEASRPTATITQEFVGRTFENETVVLDGRRYVDCTFRNCTFVWNGGAWEVRHWTRRDYFRWKTTWQPAIETINQLKAFDLLSDADFAASWGHSDTEVALQAVDVRKARASNEAAVEKLRMLRAVAVHFLKVGNRLPYLGSTKQQEDVFRARVLAQLAAWEQMVMEVRPHTSGAENEWDRFKLLGNMAVPDVISEKIDRLDTLIARLSQTS